MSGYSVNEPLFPDLALPMVWCDLCSVRREPTSPTIEDAYAEAAQWHADHAKTQGHLDKLLATERQHGYR
jgi:hypothetical protein